MRGKRTNGFHPLSCRGPSSYTDSIATFLNGPFTQCGTFITDGRFFFNRSSNCMASNVKNAAPHPQRNPSHGRLQSAAVPRLHSPLNLSSSTNPNPYLTLKHLVHGVFPHLACCTPAVECPIGRSTPLFCLLAHPSLVAPLCDMRTSAFGVRRPRP